jgi:hypothetical protein
MKKFFIITFLLTVQWELFAQNVGIGTITPAAKLDVTKPPGTVPTAIFRGSVNASYFNLGTNEDILLRGGKFASNILLTDQPGVGNVGIGTNNPIFPLSFPGVPGDKISLWNDGTTTHYGFGIQAGLFQMFAKNPVDDIAFGYGGSGNFTETMRVKGNGNIGIGTNAPITRLDIASPGNWDLINTEGDIRLGNSSYRLKMGIALGGNGIGTAGIMQQGGVNLLNIGSNGKYQLQINGADNSVNINNAALRVNGNTGSDGQLLVSGGASVPTWQSISSLLKTYYLYNSHAPLLITTTTATELPNGIITLTFDRPTRLIVCATFRMINDCPLIGGCEGRAWFNMYTDGVAQTYATVSLSPAGGGYNNGSINNYFQDVGPGTHIIKFYAQKASGDSGVNYWATVQYATIIALPL